jgi:membrane protease subunit (stomatin/prohibitin family)
VDQGGIVEFPAQPGEFVWDKSTEPSIFYGPLGENLKKTWEVLKKRFTMGGDTAKDQRIYYFNIKEIIGNKYGTASPVPFRVVDERAAIDMDIAIRCFGEYSYRITNPMLFYKNVCGNISQAYLRSEIDSQLKSELLTALQPAFARISEMGVRYSAIPGHTTELAKVLKEELSEQWKEYRGIEIQRVGVSSVKASEEDEQKIKEMQQDAAYMDPRRAAAYTVRTDGQAKVAAASNAAGAATGFMGMGMAPPGWNRPSGSC